MCCSSETRLNEGFKRKDSPTYVSVCTPYIILIHISVSIIVINLLIVGIRSIQFPCSVITRTDTAATAKVSTSHNLVLHMIHIRTVRSIISYISYGVLYKYVLWYNSMSLKASNCECTRLVIIIIRKSM